MDPGMLIAARESEAVTRLKFLNFQARLPDGTRVFAFEGEDDRIVWEVWIRRLCGLCEFEAFLCNGKREARKLSHIAEADNQIGSDLWIFVDRDFDELENFAHVNQVFVTDRYSIENYLVDEVCVDLALREVFPLNGHPDRRARILELYQSMMGDFVDVVSDLNVHLIAANDCSIRREDAPKVRISSIASIELGNVNRVYAAPSDLFPLEREPNDAETEAAAEKASKMVGRHHFRGKFFLLFFGKFWSLLSANFQAGGEFFDGVAGRSNFSELTLANHARRSPLPSGLENFLGRACHS